MPFQKEYNQSNRTTQCSKMLKDLQEKENFLVFLGTQRWKVDLR